jgi:hypothetical protein
MRGGRRACAPGYRAAPSGSFYSIHATPSFFEQKRKDLPQHLAAKGLDPWADQPSPVNRIA